MKRKGAPRWIDLEVVAEGRAKELDLLGMPRIKVIIKLVAGWPSMISRLVDQVKFA
jgi:hypothetical protein